MALRTRSLLKTIYAIPGLGTTAELFRFLNVEGVELRVLTWPHIGKDDTMRSYAEKFLPQIDTSRPFYLAGVSFGGMLCVELSELVRPERTFLISSAKCRHELPLVTRFFDFFPLHRLLGEKNLRRLNARSRHVIGFEKLFLPEFIAMMESMEPDYYVNSISCIVGWKRKEPAKNLVHLHGSADRLLPLRYVKADHVITGGTHAMIVYNAKEIAHIIKAYL